MTGHAWVDLTPEHAEMLERQAILPEVAAAAGVRSITGAGQLPEDLAAMANLAPGILYVWRYGDTVEYQLATDDRSGDRPKYVFRKGATPIPNVVRETGGNTVVLAEGTKQQLAAASWAPPEWSIYGIAGCWNWTQADLSFVSGRAVTVIYDGDVATNRAVWDAGEKLAETLELYGAKAVAFAKIPVTGSEGLDDLLGRMPTALRRQALEKLVSKAGKLPKKPPRKAATSGCAFIDPAAGGLQVRQLAGAIFQRWPMALTRERKPAVYRDGVYHIDGTALVAATTHLMGEYYRPAHLAAVTDVLSGTLYDRGLLLPDHLNEPLLNVRNGMLDLATGTLYPHEPRHLSTQQIAVDWNPDALAPTYVEWLKVTVGDQAEDLEEVTSMMLDPSRTPSKAVFLFGPSRSGKSTYLRLMQSVAGRNNISAVSLHQLTSDRFMAACVYGKMLNSYADLSAAHIEDISIFKLMAGDDVIEANRKYGGTFNFTNRALFAFSANELPTVGESSRAYSERIKPFRFGVSFAGREEPAIETAMRRELEGILVRWVAAWQRRQRRGSWAPTAPDVAHEFEVRSDRVRQWVDERMIVWPVEGVMQEPDRCSTPRDLAREFNRWAQDNAGAPMGERKIVDRLKGMREVRECRRRGDKARALNVTGGRNEAEAGGTVAETATGGENGKCLVRGPGGRMVAVVAEVPHPPYLLSSHAGTESDGSFRESGKGGWGTSATTATTPTRGDTLVFDLETADGDRLHSHGPGFVRIAGYLLEGGEPTVTTDITDLTERVRAAGRIVGHNILGFDLVALSRYHGLDLWPLARDGKIIDTMIKAQLHDPPPARMNAGQIARHMKLDSVGERMLGHRKHGDLKELAKKHGGFDRIPLDDPEFHEYIRGDLLIPRDLDRLMPDTEYSVREHKAAAIFAQMGINGMRVDLPLLRERYETGEARKAELKETLHDKYGMPRTTKDGKSSKAPWATEAGKEAIGSAMVALGLPYAPRTANGSVALGQDVMAAIKIKFADNAPLIELVELLGDLQGVRSIYGTVTEHLVGDRVHPTIDIRQVSGRSSTTKPGMTVMGKHAGRVTERAIMLPEGGGHTLIAFDLAQVDARAVAAHSQDHAYMDLFAPGVDLWTELAAQLLGDPGKRQLVKPIGHGSNYGMGPDSIERQYGIDREIIDRFFAERQERFPRLIEWQNEVREQARSGGLLDNGFGRLMRPDPDRAHTQGPALIGQGAAADILKEGLIRLVTQYPDVLPLLRLQVHDEIVISCPVDWATDLEKAVLSCLQFEWAPPGATRPIQIMADKSKRGSNWAACYQE